jgi:hypothetical protein
MAKEGHQWAPFRGRAATLSKCACGMRLSREGKMNFLGGPEQLFGGVGAISQFETGEQGGGGREIIFEDCKISLDNT